LREGQVTDRYAKAIEQLGSEKLEVRVGGIYALERIASDSVRDGQTVIDVLAAFITEQSRTARQSPGDNDESLRSTPSDLQAAITVIGRRDIKRERRRLNLYGADLTHADLGRINLANASLGGAKLTRANLAWIDLRDANLNYADLSRALLFEANLAGALLEGADFSGSDLTNANLSDADLLGFHDQPAKFTDANLTGVLFPGLSAVPEGWIRRNDGRLERDPEA
jgi:uncharacterized protein YjbI with pentapeptide repeats